MDLAIGAKQAWVMMDLLTKDGRSKVVQRCTYPLTGVACIKRIYTDLATLECTPQGLRADRHRRRSLAPNPNNWWGFRSPRTRPMGDARPSSMMAGSTHFLETSNDHIEKK